MPPILQRGWRRTQSLKLDPRCGTCPACDAGGVLGVLVDVTAAGFGDATDHNSGAPHCPQKLTPALTGPLQRGHR